MNPLSLKFKGIEFHVAKAREVGVWSMCHTAAHREFEFIVQEFFSTFSHNGELTTPLSTGHRAIF